MDPASTVGTAQTLPVRVRDEDRVLGKPISDAQKRLAQSRHFFGCFEYQGISDYLNVQKFARHAPYRIGAQKQETRSRAKIAAAAKMREDRVAAAAYIQDYVQSLGPIRVDP